ncbi:hypothetical protein CUJ83_04230 [Methanocella sp. CWC-04]|uniref:ABC transmembrane type-2 domain-containing protein n=1 Tax=Methanooceanicella nereidis TaxID=2052831 RepID=A0AAP2RBV2_9EURY|nr:ABC transporter permease [Methanocella sp. CWC-04]MCD1294202.1 hypothetical protein [Methanocella sp. CWC-04]
MSRIANEIKYSLIQFFRSRQSIFLAFILPIILLIVLGYLLGGQSDSITLYYADRDVSQASKAFIGTLEGTGSFIMEDGSGKDLAQLLNDGELSVYIEIPQGFEKNVTNAKSTGAASGAVIDVFYDPSKISLYDLIFIMRQAIDDFSMGMTGTREIIALNSQDVVTSGISYIEFLVPGIIGMCMMFSAVNLTAGTMVRYQVTGISRKLETTPMSTIEWNAYRIITGTIIVFLSVAVTLFAAWAIFGVVPGINVLSILMLITGSVMFTGLGMTVAFLSEDNESANAAAFAITIPLMLISGSFYPIDQLPCMLFFIAAFSPLTYMNDGLRSAMFSYDTGDAIANLLICVALCVIIFCVGVAILSGKEGQSL